MIDNNLKFDIHVHYIKKKIQEIIGAMYRGSSLLPVKYRKMFANSLILPHFDYLDQGGIGYQVSDITSTKCSFGYFSLDTPTPFAVLTVFLDNT